LRASESEVNLKSCDERFSERRGIALRAASIACIALWLLGIVMGRMMGGFVHAFLVLGIVLALARYVRKQ